jgi:hypothetical protein
MEFAFASLGFTLVFMLVVFGYLAYSEKKKAEIERLLIEQGKADALIELRRANRQWLNDFLSGRSINPWVLVLTGVAAIVSAGILRAAGQYVAAQGLDVWLAIFGVFALAWGVALAMTRRAV